MTEENEPETVRVEGIEIPIETQSEESSVSVEGLVPPDLPQNTPHQASEEVLQTECAFLVFLTPEGIWAADSSKIGNPIVMGREATFHDFRHAAHDILYGIELQETAQTVVMMQQQAVQQTMIKARQAEEFARLSAATTGGPGGGLDLSHLKKN